MIRRWFKGHTHPSASTAALFSIAKARKLPKCPSQTDGKEVWSTLDSGYYQLLLQE